MDVRGEYSNVKQAANAVGSGTSSDKGIFRLCLLRPTLFTKGHFLASLFAAAVDFALPPPVLAQSKLGVAGVVKVDLGDLGLDESPHGPVTSLAISMGSISFDFVWVGTMGLSVFAHQ